MDFFCLIESKTHTLRVRTATKMDFSELFAKVKNKFEENVGKQKFPSLRLVRGQYPGDNNPSYLHRKKLPIDHFVASMCKETGIVWHRLLAVFYFVTDRTKDLSANKKRDKWFYLVRQNYDKLLVALKMIVEEYDLDVDV